MNAARIALFWAAAALSGCVVIPADDWYGGHRWDHRGYSGYRWDGGWPHREYRHGDRGWDRSRYWDGH
jgi:hypothetical protein